jgi:DNA segregation ATPase FtsK/SpoIIIE, S-DNA-T family
MPANHRPAARNHVSGDSVFEIIKDGLRRRLAELTGVGLLAITAALVVALASWSVRDPSFNYAVDGPVKNWLGRPGAMISDVLIQLFGLSIIMVLAPVAVWGLLLIRRRNLDALAARSAAWVIAVLSTAGFAALLPRANSWPLPTGLGGAVGDAIERLPLMILGTAGWAKVLAALMFVVAAILAAQFATAREISTSADEDDIPEKPARRGHEDDHRDDEPSKAIVAVGAVVHGTTLALAAMRRGYGSLKTSAGQKISSGARQMVETVTRDDAQSFAMAGHPAPAPSGPRREPVFHREQAPVPREHMSEVSAPVYSRQLRDEPATPAAHVAAAPAAPASAAPRAGYGAAVQALQLAAKRRLGLLPAEEPAPPPASARYTASGDERPGERAAIEALQAAARRRIERRVEPLFDDLNGAADAAQADTYDEDDQPAPRLSPASVQPSAAPAAPQPRVLSRVAAPAPAVKPGKREVREAQPDLLGREAYQLPPISLLNEPKKNVVQTISEDALEQNARMLESVLEDFGVRGEIINVRPGPVVTLYELEPAPGTKSSRVIGLADDIARSMSAVSARVAVVPGRNAIGVELPNQRRETVYFRELIGSQEFEKSNQKLALSLGKTIGGEAVITELAKMPHLLVAGTTGSGKSVAINTMILSLLYRLTPEQCRLIMIDPKMLELSIYDGIPHLLTPVVTDPKKAVVALKWAVREMEDRYKKMSKIGVRNIDGFNSRVAEAKANGEVIEREVQTGFDKETGTPTYETEEMPLDQLPYIVVIIDEMADLMMVAGKDIEGAVQRLAQMARAAGIHVIMATQRPSVDVITGTIKANFPTRISFQVTSKIDSRTILGEMGAEQLLGQGDMLYMAGGGRINRVHGPFVSDEEVERVVNHLKRQGRPQYLESITREEDEGGEDGEDSAVFDKTEMGEEGGDLYEQAVRVVLRDKKASTSYIQRRLQIGYNRAASLMERMEDEGVVGPANHAGKREILVEGEG